MSKFVVENRICDKEETLPRNELTALQGAKLKETVERVQHVPFYKEAFSRTGVTPEKIRSVEDLQRLPFNEVAERMGRSRPAVQMLWMRALRKLQEILEEQGA